MNEVVLAIALLCQVNHPDSIISFHGAKIVQQQCQKQLIKCVFQQANSLNNKIPEDALAQCVATVDY